jgi:hypothetical protein
MPCALWHPCPTFCFVVTSARRLLMGTLLAASCLSFLGDNSPGIVFSLSGSSLCFLCQQVIPWPTTEGYNSEISSDSVSCYCCLVISGQDTHNHYFCFSWK